MIETGKVPNEDYAEYVISTSKCTVKQEDALVRQIFYPGCSAKTPDPINLGIIAPTSEGKTYPVIEGLKPFPKDIVWKIGSMSAKVLVRQKSDLLDRNNQPIGHKLRDLRKEYRQVGTSRERKNEIELGLDDLQDGAKFRIKLSGTILVFLEPPQHELWNILKPILSHDDYFIEHPYVDKTDAGFQVKKMVTEGWPACIFCSAKDESDWPAWPEVVSRFLITSPNMIQRKYQESNTLIGMKKGLPSLLQKQFIVSDQQTELARNCCQHLLSEIENRFAGQNPENPSNPVWIPYGEISAEALPANKGSDVRTAKRIFSFLNIIPLTRAHLRPKLYYEMQPMVVATLEDLTEVLRITHNVDGLPAYKLDFFKNIFCGCYNAKHEPVTSRELCEYMRERTGKQLNTDNMKKTYLNELQNVGYIDSRQKTKEEGDAREYIFWPIIDISNYRNSDQFDNYPEHPRINLSKNHNFPDKNWLAYEILRLKNNRIRLTDKDGKEQTATDFINAYQSSLLIRYFTKPEISYKSQAFGAMIQIPQKHWAELSKKLSNLGEFDN